MLFCRVRGMTAFECWTCRWSGTKQKYLPSIVVHSSFAFLSRSIMPCTTFGDCSRHLKLKTALETRWSGAYQWLLQKKGDNSLESQKMLPEAEFENVDEVFLLFSENPRNVLGKARNSYQRTQHSRGNMMHGQGFRLEPRAREVFSQIGFSARKSRPWNFSNNSNMSFYRNYGESFIKIARMLITPTYQIEWNF